MRLWKQRIETLAVNQPFLHLSNFALPLVVLADDLPLHPELGDRAATGDHPLQGVTLQLRAHLRVDVIESESDCVVESENG